MNLAVVTPWPPMKTGIADYAYDLVVGLINSGHKVSVYTTEEQPEKVNGVEFKKPEKLHDSYHHYDDVIYQMGNNSDFHLYMVSLIFKFPGVIHLHDLSLHHIMAWILYANGDKDLYFDVINKWYGPEVKKQFSELLTDGSATPWDTNLVDYYPFFEEVIQNTSHCIIHSEHAKAKIQKVFPSIKCTVIPQVYTNAITEREEVNLDDVLQIGIFGGVDFNKRIDVILKAVEELYNQNVKFKLNIVGSVSKECKYLFELLKDKPYADKIELFGRADHNKFLSILSKMDICVALRFPTMGETSAVVMRSLQMNIPVIVSDVGWYSELPRFIPKIKPETEVESKELFNLLLDYSRKSDSYHKLLSETKEYSCGNLNFESTISSYIESLA